MCTSLVQANSEGPMSQFYGRIIAPKVFGQHKIY